MISVTTSLQLHSVDHCAKTSETYLFKELIFQFWKIFCGFVYINVNVVTDDYQSQAIFTSTSRNM